MVPGTRLGRVCLLRDKKRPFDFQLMASLKCHADEDGDHSGVTATEVKRRTSVLVQAALHLDSPRKFQHPGVGTRRRQRHPGPRASSAGTSSYQPQGLQRPRA